MPQDAIDDLLALIPEGATQATEEPPEKPTHRLPRLQVGKGERGSAKLDEESLDRAAAELEQLFPVRETTLGEKVEVGVAGGLSDLAKAPELAGKAAERLSRLDARRYPMLKGAGIIGSAVARHIPAIKQLADWGRELESAVNDVEDPRFADQSYTAQVARGFGSMLPFAVAGPLGGVAAVAATGAAQTAVPIFEDVLEETGDEDKAWAGAFIGVGLGATEALGVGRVLSKLDRGTAGSLRKAMIRLATEGTEEALQEWVQTFGQSVATQKLSGKDVDYLREITQASRAATVGALLGAGVSGAVEVGNKALQPNTGLEGAVPGEQGEITPQEETFLGVQEALGSPGKVQLTGVPGATQIPTDLTGGSRGEAGKPVSEVKSKPKPGEEAEAEPLQPQEAAQAILEGRDVPVEQLTPEAISIALAERQKLTPPARPAPGESAAAQAHAAPTSGAVQEPAGTVAGGVPLHQLSYEELETLEAETRKSIRGDEKRLGVAEIAKRLDRLQRRAGDAYLSAAEQDKAQAEADAIEAGLTDEQSRVLFGIGETRPQPDEIEDVRVAVGNARFSPTQSDLVFELKWPMGVLSRIAERIKDGETPGSMELSRDETKALAVVRAAQERADEEGWDFIEIQKQAAHGYAERFGDEGDAEYMLRGFAPKKKTAAKTDDPKQLASGESDEPLIYAHTDEPAKNFPEPAEGSEWGPVKPVPIESIKLKQLENFREGVDEERVQKFVELMSDGKPLPPVTAIAGREGETWLLDGHHRVVAAQRLGFDHVPLRMMEVSKPKAGKGERRTRELALTEEDIRAEEGLKEVSEYLAGASMLSRSARTNPITGLMNKRADKEYSERIIRIAQRKPGTKVHRVRVDLTNFKAVNAFFGHEFGDQILSEIGAEWGKIARQGDARPVHIGGDEFAATLLLPEGVDIGPILGRIEEAAKGVLERNGLGEIQGYTFGADAASAEVQTQGGEDPLQYLEDASGLADKLVDEKKAKRGVSSRKFQDLPAGEQKALFERARAERLEKVEKRTPQPEPFDEKLAREAMTGALTGRPFRARLIRGTGGKKKYSYATVPVLGPGRYTTDDRKHAESFGPTITAHDVELKNPLVIDGNSQWRALTKRAGWPFPNLDGLGREEVEAHIAALRAMLERDGHDGVIVRGTAKDPDGSWVSMLGGDQVVEFKPPAAPSPKRSAERLEKIGKRRTAQASGVTFGAKPSIAPESTQPFTPDAIKETFGVTDPQAQAIDALASAMGLDPSKLRLVKGGKPGKGALRQAAPGAWYFDNILDALDRWQSKGTREQLIAHLNKVKGAKEEAEWIGLDEWLKSRPKVTRDEARAFVEENRVDVREVSRGAPTRTELAAQRERNQRLDDLEDAFFDAADALGDKLGAAGLIDRKTFPMSSNTAFYMKERDGTPRKGYLEAQAAGFQFELDALEAAADVWKNAQNAYAEADPLFPPRGSAKYGQYVTPGGEEYRELLLTLRGNAPPGEQTHFVGGHFEEGNILAHIRFNDRTDAQGRNILFIEEVQSDWHQAGKRKGYGKRSVWDIYRIDQGEPQLIGSGATKQEAESGSESIALRLGLSLSQVYVRETRGAVEGVLDAPFKGTGWPRLAMKRMLAYAAEHGYDGISWTTGQMQADRYSLSKQVNQISWSPVLGKADQRVSIDVNDGRSINLVVDSKGVVSGSPDHEGQPFVGKSLDDVIGKDIAKKIMADLGPRREGSLSGEGLNIGGEGMRAFYDRELVSVANELGKKLGVRVEEGSVGFVEDAAYEEGESNWWFDLGSEFGQLGPFSSREEAIAAGTKRLATPFLPLDATSREAIKEQGFPLFQGDKGAVEFAEGGQAIIRALESPDVSTGVHELAHVARRFLLDRGIPAENRLGITDEQIAHAEAWSGAIDGKWTTEAEEKFARGFERYLRDGKSPTLGLKKLFAQFKTWLHDIYKKLAGSPIRLKITPEMRSVYDALVSREEQEEAMVSQQSSREAKVEQVRQVEPVRSETPPSETIPDQLYAFPGELLPDVKNALDYVFRKLGYIRNQKSTVAGIIPTETRTERQIRRWQDRMRGVKTLQSAIIAAGGEISDATDVYLQEELMKGRTKDRIDEANRKFFDPILTHLRKSGISSEEFGEALMARHAPERNKAILAIDPKNDAGSGITDEEAQEIMDRVEGGKRAKAFDRAFSLFDAMVRETRSGWVRDGLMSAKDVRELEERWQFYAPLRSDLDDTDTSPFRGTGRGVDVRGGEFRQALGRHSRADAKSVLAYAMTQTEQGIMRGEKNRVGLSLLNLIRANEGASIMEGFAKISPKQSKRAVVNGVVKRVYDPRFKEADNVLLVHEDGDHVWIEINKRYQNVADGLKSLGAENSGIIVKWGGRATRYLASINTRYNPVFPLFNAIRDAAGAFVNSQEHGLAFAVRTVRDVPLAISALAFGGGRFASLVREYRSSGAPVSFLDLNNFEDKLKRIEKMTRAQSKSGAAGQLARGWRAMLEAINSASDIVENATRFSAYVHAREDLGMSVDRAASWSKNLTVNFERRGDYGAAMNALYMFANAGVQSTARVRQAVRHPGVKKLLVAAGMGLMAWDQVMRALGGEDDDGRPCWDKIPSYIKRHNFVFLFPKSGDGCGRMVTIPAPFTYDLVQTIAFQLSGAASGHIKPSDAFGEIMSAGVEAFDPIGSGSLDLADTPSVARALTPTVGDPIVELATNRDWKGSLIGPHDYGDGKPDSERYYPDKTSHASIAVTRWLNRVAGGDELGAGPGAIGRLLDISPATLDHIGSWMSGGLGRSISQAYTTSEKLSAGEKPNLREIPFVSRLVREPSAYSSSKDFHDLQNALRIEKKRAERDKRVFSLYGLYKESNAREERRQKRSKEIDQLTGEAKEKALRDLDREMQQFNVRVRKAMLTEQ